MTANINPSPQQRDDQLAEFVDRLLDDKAPQDYEIHVQDEELLELFDTAMRIKRAFGDESLDRSKVRCIKANLISEWHRGGYSRQRKSIWQRFKFRRTTWKSSAWRQRAVGLVIVVFLILLFAIAYPFISSAEHTLTGAADGQINLIPILLIFTLMLGVAYWLIQSRK
jgi:hypothetical protein